MTSDDLDYSIVDDELRGADTIAAYTRRTPRQIYHCFRTGSLPIFKLCGVLTMRKSSYRRRVEELEQAALRDVEGRQ